MNIFVYRDRDILVDENGNFFRGLRASDFVKGENGVEEVFEDPSISSCGVVVNASWTLPDGARFSPLRWYFFEHDAQQVRQAGRMLGLAKWRHNMQFCPSCGTRLELARKEIALACPGCGKIHFPRIEPCIITIVRKGDEILLLRNIRDTEGIYSCLSGFVEIGETVEQALRREIKEESNLEVENIRYVGSQSWPFPDQLMLAFYCDYKSGELKIQESEIKDAQWFRKDNLPKLYGKGSIAWRLINEDFSF
ncbi:MAG: NAD(+) diphosphatase [Bacteroidales bacterium]|nr:NAD(+) diphosphatase [Bacteroidales bacterium]